MARVYADVNQHMPKSYWDYDSVNISWGALENYEVVRKIGMAGFARGPWRRDWVWGFDTESPLVPIHG